MFNETTKQRIRERDEYTCQNCGKTPSKHVHHIDYDKMNSSDKNLINVCGPCNSKANANREYWTEYYINIQKNRRIIKG